MDMGPSDTEPMGMEFTNTETTDTGSMIWVWLTDMGSMDIGPTWGHMGSGPIDAGPSTEPMGLEPWSQMWSP